MKQCSACRSVHVRRSTFARGEREAHLFQSPYRCDDCGRRFWVLSRAVRMRAVTTAVIFAMIAIICTAFATLISGIGSSSVHDSATADTGTSTSVVQLVPVNPTPSASRR